MQERQVEDASSLFLCLGGGEILVDMVQNLGLWSVLVARNPSESVRYHCRGLWYDYIDERPIHRYVRRISVLCDWMSASGHGSTVILDTITASWLPAAARAIAFAPVGSFVPF